MMWRWILASCILLCFVVVVQQREQRFSPFTTTFSPYRPTQTCLLQRWLEQCNALHRRLHMAVPTNLAPKIWVKIWERVYTVMRAMYSIIWGMSIITTTPYSKHDSVSTIGCASYKRENRHDKLDRLYANRTSCSRARKVKKIRARNENLECTGYCESRQVIYDFFRTTKTCLIWSFFCICLDWVCLNYAILFDS